MTSDEIIERLEGVQALLWSKPSDDQTDEELEAAGLLEELIWDIKRD